MRQVYEGKTKTVYALEDGNYLLKFKDDATGEGGVFDPGSNRVGLTIEGMGRAGLRLSEYFFRKIARAGYPTHYISSDPEQATMTVRPAVLLGNGLELICRFRATGSFIRRYGMYAAEGAPLDGYVEVTLKDDDRGDPLITKDALTALRICSAEEYETLRELCFEISKLVERELAEKGCELYDIKLEFGKVDGNIALIDEVSGGNMRVYRNGNPVTPIELSALLTTR